MKDRVAGWSRLVRALIVLGGALISAAGNANGEALRPTPTLSKPPSAILRGSIPVGVERGGSRLVRPLALEQQMRITIVLFSPRRAELEKLVAEITDPRSPSYRKFLTFKQWKATYAPSESDLDAVSAWAKQAGLREVYRFPTNTAIVVQGSVATVQSALRLQLSEYEFEGHHLYANNRRPALPPEVAGRIDTILGLNSFEQVGSVAEPALVDMPAPHVSGTSFIINRSHWQRDATPGPRAGVRRRGVGPPIPAITGPLGGTVIEPPDLWNSEAYDYNALFPLSHCCNPKNFSNGSPKEMSIAIVGNNKPQASDYQQFIAEYNLAANITELDLGGASCCDEEMTSDIDWAAAMSNGFGSWLNTAHLFVYESSGRLIDDYITALSAALAEDDARILSTSFGSYENSYGGAGAPPISEFREFTTAMLAIGWTIIAASGDRGAYEDCKTLSVSYPASDPAAIAAGGTTITLSPAGAGLSFGGESAWTGNGCGGSQGKGGGGGGGCSNTFFAPWWSSPLGQCPGNRRALPDMALNAGSPQVLYYLGGWLPGGVSGTSLAAPELAGFFAQAASYLAYLELIGQTCGNGPTPHCVPIGHPGPALFLAGPRPFYDVHDGSCNGGGVGPGYCTTAGYDLATGLGSPNMLQLSWALNRWIGGPGNAPPNVSFQGPLINEWYATDQTVAFKVSGGTLGIAGYTAQWDQDPGDPVHATPGSGDSYWNGPAVLGTTGSLSLAAAGPGCHTAFVRAWSNRGIVSTSPISYGPVCFGAPPNCNLAFSCVTNDDNPPVYKVQCAGQEDFYQTFPDGSKSSLGSATNVTGDSVLYNDDILACAAGTNNCIGFSIFVDVSKWCRGTPNPGGTPQPANCRACIEAGGYCTSTGCMFQ